MLSSRATACREGTSGEVEQREPLVSGEFPDVPFSHVKDKSSSAPAHTDSDAAVFSVPDSDSTVATERASQVTRELPVSVSQEEAAEPLLRVGVSAEIGSGEVSGLSGREGGRGPRGLEAKKRVNVLLTLAFTVVNTMYLACAQGPVFDMYVFILGHNSNKWVGNTESLSGVVALLVAAPVGLLVDRYSRSKICKALCILGMVATVTSLWGVGRDSLGLIILSLVLWGLFWEASNSATNALFTDSLSRGNRTQWYSWKGMVRNASWAVAPLLMIGFFSAYGNDWDLNRVRTMILLGTIFFAPTCSLLLWFFADVLGVETSAAPIRSSRSSSFAADAVAATNNGEDGALRAADSASSVQEVDAQLSQLSMLHKSVPFIISVADLVRSMGAGMTVKFFPLFFSNEYHLTPVQLCELAVVYALSIVFFIYVAEKLSTFMGRALASQLLSLLGLVTLVTMCTATDIRFLVLAHLMRGGMQNANYPIDRSIVMDFTRSKDRGKWSTVETFTSTMWSGSAFIGGIMADKSYRAAFGVTAVIYALAWIIYLPLIFIVPKAERALGTRHGSTLVAPARETAQETPI